MMARSQCRLIVRQQPQRAQVVQENNPKNRKPIDPPPIIELKYDDRDDPSNSQWLVSPRTFMMVTLMAAKDSDEAVPGRYLIGQTVSSLHRLKDVNNKDGGYFVFGDLSARKLGHYRLRFSLFDSSKETEEVVFMGSIDSDIFPVLPQRDFGSMSESTLLTRAFSDQGVKLRVRKDNRSLSAVAGTKRSFNATPPETSSPSIHPGIYGGAVQDHHYTQSAEPPAAKRHRTSSEYDGTHLYQGLSVGDSTLAQYGGSIPSGTRSWSGHEQQRVHASYGPQQSPMNMTMIGGGRVQPMSVQPPTSWQALHQQSALPSPTPSVSNQQQPAYPSVTSQQQSSGLFGDPGAASSIPRNYYSTHYQYPNQGSYQGQHSGELQQPYPDLQMPGSSIPDASSLASAQNQGYGQGYLQSSGLYTQADEVPGGYAYINDSSRSAAF